ncbi:MAG: FIST C-terminal domain-containing protein [Bradyrhizobiaceae bacterium]|nr:FIST C-terminal domain-containing protein [Bradyrhizobiaceae bacterium]
MAEAFRTALAIDPDPQAAAGKVAAALAQQGSGGALGFIYVTDRLKSDIAAVAETLRRGTGVPQWVGTVGFGVIAGRQATYDEPAVAAMIAPWPANAFQVYDGVPAKAFAPDAFGMATAIVHVDPRNPQLDVQLKSLAASSQAYLLGGLTASRTRVYDRIAGERATQAVSGLFLSPEIPVSIGVSQGCSAIGPTRTITQTDDGLVAAVDGQPALNALLDDLSAVNETDVRVALEALHVGLPVPHSDTGDYVVRNIAGIDTNTGCIAVADNVEAGQKMFFCQRNRNAAASDLTAMVRKVHGRTQNPRGALYVACVARGPNMFESANEEVGLIQSILGDIPMIGFYANGEVAGSRIYGYTGVLALF